MEIKIEQWKREIKVITNDVMDAIENQFIFNRVSEIVAANSKINKDNLFWDHFAASFGASSVLGITRQVDERTEVISLLKLLEDIKDNPGIATKTWLADLYEATLPRQMGEQAFVEHFGSGEDVDPAILEEDIRQLKVATSKVARFRHTRIAHKNASEKLVVDLSFDEAREALKVIEELVIKYNLLLNGGGFQKLMPEIQYGWEIVFRTPWIEKNQ